MGHLLIKDFDADLQWRAKQVAHARKMTLKALVEKAIENWIQEEAVLEKLKVPVEVVATATTVPPPPPPLPERLAQAAQAAGEPPNVYVRKVIEHDWANCKVEKCEFCSLIGAK